MSNLLAFLLMGFLFIFFLFLWALRTRGSARRAADDAEVFPEGFERPSRIIVDSIFSTRDWNFMSEEGTDDVQKAFLKERAGLALLWLKQTRRHAKKLMEFHRRTVRRDIELKPSLEIKLAVNYLTFLFLCALLQTLIRVRGPFRAQRMAGRAFDVATDLWSVSVQLVAASTLQGARRSLQSG